MGWDYTRATHYTSKGTIDRKAEVDSLYNWQNETQKVDVVRSAMVGSTYYAALRITHIETGAEEITAVVVLTHADSREYFNFGIKSMGETGGPLYYDCPASILSLLSPTDDKDAIEWRTRCRERIEEKKSPNALGNLPVGSVIQFVSYNGDTVELLKHPAAYQFKRPFWYCESGNYYVPAKRIPDNYKVISA